MFCHQNVYNIMFASLTMDMLFYYVSLKMNEPIEVIIFLIHH